MFIYGCVCIKDHFYLEQAFLQTQLMHMIILIIFDHSKNNFFKTFFLGTGIFAMSAIKNIFLYINI